MKDKVKKPRPNAWQHRHRQRTPGVPTPIRTTKRLMPALRKAIVKQASVPVLNKVDNRISIFELTLEGYSQKDIGTALGISAGRVSQLLKEVLEEKTREVDAWLPHVRAIELARIDRMIVAWYHKAKSDPRASDVLRGWIERRHKIIPGMEITRGEYSGPGGGPINLSSTIDITKLDDRMLANLEEIMRVAGPKVNMGGEDLPAIEHRPSRKARNEDDE